MGWAYKEHYQTFLTEMVYDSSTDKSGNWGVTYTPTQDYGTPHKWSFVIGNSDTSRQVKTKQEALKLGNDSLPSIRLSNGPV